MFHLTEKEVNRLHGEYHDLAATAAQDGNTDRAEALQEAAKMLHDARMEGFDRRSAAARATHDRREQRQLQGSKR